MPLRGRLISISGVDGSGKTSQIERLKLSLKSEGAIVVVWSRWRPLSSLPLLVIMKRLGYVRIHPTSSIGFVETLFDRRQGTASVWCFLTQLDNLLKTGLKVAIPLLLGRTVICDRYVLDLLVENMADLHDPPNTTRVGHRLLRLLPRADMAFLIEVDPSVAFRRKPDMPTISQFIERTNLYHEMGKKMGVQALDGALPLDKIHAFIRSKVEQILHI